MWVSPMPEDTLKRFNLVQKKCRESIKQYADILIYPSSYRISEYDEAFINKLYKMRDQVAAAL